MKFIDIREIKQPIEPEIYCDIKTLVNNTLLWRERFVLENGLVLCYRCVHNCKGLPEHKLDEKTEDVLRRKGLFR